jgi:hypothetical protein
MTRQEHLLTIVGEECTEVHQRCSKALRFGMNEVQIDQPLSNKQRILQEFNDLVASMEMLFEQPIEELISKDEVSAKKKKVEKYLNYSVECGTVN